jgi:hypothetical protein
MVNISLECQYQGQNTAADIICIFHLQFLADMFSDPNNIIHQGLGFPENIVIDTLDYVGPFISIFVEDSFKSIVDMAIATNMSI